MPSPHTPAPSVEPIRAHHRQPQIRLRICRILLQRLVEQIDRLLVVEALMQQHPQRTR